MAKHSRNRKLTFLFLARRSQDGAEADLGHPRLPADSVWVGLPHFSSSQSEFLSPPSTPPPSLSYPWALAHCSLCPEGFLTFSAQLKQWLTFWSLLNWGFFQEAFPDSPVLMSSAWLLHSWNPVFLGVCERETVSA